MLTEFLLMGPRYKICENTEFSLKRYLHSFNKKALLQCLILKILKMYIFLNHFTIFQHCEGTIESEQIRLWKPSITAAGYM